MKQAETSYPRLVKTLSEWWKGSVFIVNILKTIALICAIFILGDKLKCNLFSDTHSMDRTSLFTVPRGLLSRVTCELLNVIMYSGKLYVSSFSWGFPLGFCMLHFDWQHAKCDSTSASHSYRYRIIFILDQVIVLSLCTLTGRGSSKYQMEVRNVSGFDSLLFLTVKMVPINMQLKLFRNNKDIGWKS